MRWSFAAWTALVLAGIVYHSACTYDGISISRSTATCIVRGQHDACAPPLPGFCIPPHHATTLSSKAFVKLLVTAGPALLWLPLLLLLRRAIQAADAGVGGSGAAAPTLHALSATLSVGAASFLTLVMPVRYLGALTGWDPSGHILVNGYLLLTIWMTRDACRAGTTPDDTGVNVVLLGRYGLLLLAVAEVALQYVTVITAVFYHTPSESIAGWICVALAAVIADAAVSDLKAPHNAVAWRGWADVAILCWALGAVCALAVVVLSPSVATAIAAATSIAYDVGLIALLHYALHLRTRIKDASVVRSSSKAARRGGRSVR